MQALKSRPKNKIHPKHQTHRSVYVRFLVILIIFVSYFVFISSKYGYSDGFLIAWLSWSFFVLSTPIADAGMLIDFPVRLIGGFRMVYSEMLVWLSAISLNLYALKFNPDTYEQTQILSLLHHILTHPWPLWGIILVSAVGTFLSIQIGDELLDVIKHKNVTLAAKHDLKLKLLYMTFIMLIAFGIYDFLLSTFNFQIPL